MKVWFEVEQYIVFSEDMGYGVVTAERSDGLLGVQFDADPWVMHHVDPDRIIAVEYRKRGKNNDSY